MPVTKMSDMINPQVMGDMIEAKLTALNKIMRTAKIDTTLQGVPGDTKTVPMWNYIGDATDYDPDNVNGDPIPMEKLTASTTTFTIGSIAKRIGITQKAVNSGLGDPIGEAAKQVAVSINSKLDNDVIAAAYTSTNVITASSQIGYAPIVTAVCSFNDEEQTTEKAMYIHPEQEATLLQDSSFLSADKFEGGVAVNGAIGKIAGCWIRKSKKIKHVIYEKDNTNGTITIVVDSSNETSTNKHLATIQPYCDDTLEVGDKVKALAKGGYYKNLIIKLEPDSSETEYTESELPALTIFLKKDIQVDVDWKAEYQRWDIVAAKYYGAALTNVSKVLILKTNKTA